MKYFTSDTHFGDERLNLFHRDLLELTSSQIDVIIYDNLYKKITENDTLYHLGDVALDESKLMYIKMLRGKKILIRGNYDMEDKIEQNLLEECFDEIYDELEIEIGGIKFHLNHFPNKCIDKEMSLSGHVHGLWKVQPNMINVGTDCWHFQPVSEEKILFTYNAIKNHYDDNVFIKD